MKLNRYALLLISLLGASAAMAQATVVEVFKSPYCGCCGKWVEHLRQSGFEVKAHDVEDVPAVRQKLGMPDRLGSCHTAKIGGYVVEGHVPAADIQRLLKEKPKALGLSVPSMPPGSPGMESSKPMPYQTLLVQSDGSTRVFAQH
ncbi:DUF411 domain-containing protein [Denitratisoma oestradiolicum]|jgi:hypothetical protein|uniref:Uncharacterized protein n=1 Tax=Denitratisoma oestradiolicum TaxID=311182 RepID=A0A6S6Y1H8_9PROT|nr:DUF411 domain-containing protein [Denitratisoma oestradiolicum]TWO82114.1 metal-binding protein [Denitratisoma oestradiolicum]CAB1369044.1 conserved exported protein of unknown function [Denitratisoma oestradiolicum]